MKTTTLVVLLGMFFLSFNADAQIKIKKPSIGIKKPSLGSGSGDVEVPGRDPSGLFTRTTSDPSAEHHRKKAVENLELLETTFTQASIDYEMLTKLMKDNEITLGHIAKLEPNVNSEKYQERYAPLKERADKENGIYAEAVTLEKLFEQQFRAPTQYKEPSVLSYRTDSYGAHDECYCRTYAKYDKTYAEYMTAKKEYEALTAQLVGYSDESTQKAFTDMNTCLENGNKYAIWAASTNVETLVVAYSAKEKALDPKSVIKRCDDYLVALTQVESDFSLSLSKEALAALTTGRATINKTKSENELYISSGQFQAHRDKLHAEKIAKVFLPKAVRQNANLESGAKKYIMSTEYIDYFKGETDATGISSTMRAVTVTSQPYVRKNEFGIPTYQYEEIWVAFKGADGKCYMAAVYANYTYKGGGTFATTPTWGADSPEEMACGNVNK
jgi:hypothetical protein